MPATHRPAVPATEKRGRDWGPFARIVAIALRMTHEQTYRQYPTFPVTRPVTGRRRAGCSTAPGCGPARRSHHGSTVFACGPAGAAALARLPVPLGTLRR